MGKYSDLAKNGQTEQDKKENPTGIPSQIPKFPNSQKLEQQIEQLPVGEDFIKSVVDSVIRDEQRSSNYRVSGEEKDRLEDMVFSLKRSGFKRLSANLAIRIAFVLVIQDYERNGEQSMIYRVVQSRFPNYKD
jgi:hypothetical protein